MKTKTLNELIHELQTITAVTPERGELPVFIYGLEDFTNECPQPIKGIDNTISDRIDINSGDF